MKSHRHILFAVIAAIILLAAGSFSPASAKSFGGGGGSISSPDFTGDSAGSNVAAVSASGAGQAFLGNLGKFLLVVRYALEIPVTVVSQSAIHLTGLVGTIGSFVVKATVDDDSRAGLQTLIEIHQVDTVTGIKAGSAGHYARSAGFTNAEFAELIGWSE